MPSKEEFLSLFSATYDETKGCAEFLYNNRFTDESITTLMGILGTSISEIQIKFIKELKKTLEGFTEEQRSAAFQILVDAIKEVPNIAPIVLCIKDYTQLRIVVDYLTDFPEYIRIINDFLSIYETNRDKVVIELCKLMMHVNTTHSLGFVMVQRFASEASPPDTNLYFINLINSERYLGWLESLTRDPPLGLAEYHMMIEIAATLSKELYVDPSIDFLTCSLSHKETMELYSLLLRDLKYLAPLMESIRVITSKPEAVETIKEIDLNFIKWLIISMHPYFDDKKRLIKKFFPLGINRDELPKVISALAYINSNYSHLMLGQIYFFYYNNTKMAKFFLNKIPGRAGVYYTEAQLLLASMAFLKGDFSAAKDLLEDTTASDRKTVGMIISDWGQRQDETIEFFMAGLLREAATRTASLERKNRMPTIPFFFKEPDRRTDSDATAATEAADAAELGEEEGGALTLYKP